MANKQLSYTAERVDELLGIVDGLGEATTTEAGLMSAEDKAKLDSVEDGAEENVIVGVQVGGLALTPADKIVNIPADSAPTSESTNLVRSGGVYTAIQQVANALLNYYTKAQVDALLAGVHQFTYQVVAELPDASADTMYILYFVPSSDPQTQNVKDEYITIRTGSEGAYAYIWERIGSTEINLSDYPTTEEMNAAIAAAVASKADKDDDAVEGNLAKFDASGNPVDAGITAEKVAKKGEIQTFAGNLVDTRSAGTRQSFAFRQSGGDGVNYMRKILGRTEAFNQLVTGGQTHNGLTATLSDGVFAISGTSAATYAAPIVVGTSMIVGHKYVFLAQTIANPNNISFGMAMLNQSGGSANSIFTANAVGNSCGFLNMTAGTDFTGVKVQVSLIDLTLEYGSGNEPTTLAQFRALHPLGYYSPASKLINNAATGLETTGLNQWDEEWEVGSLDNDGNPTANTIRSKNFIPVIGGKPYYVKIGNTWAQCYAYNANKEHIAVWGSDSTNPKTLPSDARYVKFRTSTAYGTTYNHDICINLSDPDRNGEYEPYWKRDIVLGLDNLACHDEDDNAVVVNGLDGVGTVQDELIVENGWGTKIIKRRGRRAYQAGDESDATLMTDGTNTDYPLATPKVLTIDNPIPALIEVDNLGTEKRLPEDTAADPQAPFECDSNYSISVANLVRKLNS